MPRLTVVAIAILFFGNGFVYASWIPRLPEIRENLAMSDTVLGATLVGAGIGGLVMSLISGMIVDRFGSRSVVVLSSLILTVTIPIIALAPTAGALFAILILIGSADGLTDVAMNAQALQIQHRMARSILTRVHAMWSVGTLTGGIIAAWAASASIALGMQLSVIAVAMVLAVAACAPVLLPTDAGLHDHHGADVAPATSEPNTTPPASSTPIPVGEPATNRARWGVVMPGSITFVLFVVGILAILVELPPTEWASLVMIERFDVSVGAAGLGFVAFTAGMVLGRSTGDFFVDRFGPETFRRASAVIALVGVVIAATSFAPWIAMIGFFIAGSGGAALFPLAIRRAGELIPGAKGIAMFSSGARLGILIGPILMGVMSDLSSRSIALLLLPGLAAAATAAIRLPDRPTRTAAAATVTPHR